MYPAFRVPFETADGKIEIASISDGTPLEISPGKYALQVEFLEISGENYPEVNVRLNQGEVECSILKGDDDVDVDGELDLVAEPAS